MTSLIEENPAHLDTRNLEVIPLEEFAIMGSTDHRVNPAEWRLELTGKVKKPLRTIHDDTFRTFKISNCLRSQHGKNRFHQHGHHSGQKI